MDLDPFDRQLLALVQEDAGQTAEQLAQQVALSPSAIQRRLRRLRDEGVIERQIAVLDARRLGGTLFLAQLHLQQERPESLAALREELARETAIQQAYYVTGEADFLLVVAVPDAQRYEALMAALMRRHACIARYSSAVTLGVVKRGLSLPLD